MISPFLNQILVNFKTSNNFFFTNNDRKFTYDEAYKKLLSFNTFFKKYKNEKIALFSDKSIDYYVAVLGIFLSGNTWVQISPNLPKKKVDEIIKFSKIKIGVYDKSFSNKKFLKLKRLKFTNYLIYPN